MKSRCFGIGQTWIPAQPPPPPNATSAWALYILPMTSDPYLLQPLPDGLTRGLRGMSLVTYNLESRFHSLSIATLHPILPPSPPTPAGPPHSFQSSSTCPIHLNMSTCPHIHTHTQRETCILSHTDTHSHVHTHAQLNPEGHTVHSILAAGTHSKCGETRVHAQIWQAGSEQTLSKLTEP